ncbi:histone-lysine N-methyltransferase SETMAR-like [Oratosquilla oratoria]|uniref:histone-lysine N-methyltransferase SETMAR-like n=1 Tax=Oratosquilla oratoria TaxID=337810 RepID=UPI003F7665A1
MAAALGYDVSGLSRERVENILHKEVDMSKVSAHWVSRLLTSDQKHTRMVVPQANLAHFETDPVSFRERFLTQDECWVHHFEPETKRQSMQWRHTSSLVPKKARVVSSAGRVMSSVFWDAKGIVFIDYLQKGQTSNGEYCANLLIQM